MQHILYILKNFSSIKIGHENISVLLKIPSGLILGIGYDHCLGKSFNQHSK